MITIFSTPRPFTDEFARLQRNAIRSWTLLGRDCQIILINDEERTTEAVAAEMRVELIREFKSNEYGTPLLDDVFGQVRARARHDILAHVNADIFLFPDFVDAIVKFARTHNKEDFLLLGRRWNLDVPEAVDFARSDWKDGLLKRAKSEGQLHSLSGMDYWVFPKSSRVDPPAFCVGRPGMDSWLVFNAKKRGIPVLDATAAITVIHQQHGYPKKRAPHFELECERNVQLAGGRANMLSLREADWLLTESGELSRPSWERVLLAHLARYTVWRNLLGVRRWMQRKVAGSSR